MFKRNPLESIGIAPIIHQYFGAREATPTAPCAFPFDASKKGVSLKEKFYTDKQRGYIFYLYIHHNSDGRTKELLRILNANSALFDAQSVRTGRPIRITSDNFMDEKNFSSIRQQNDALTKANTKYWDAVHKAIGAKLNKQACEYLWLPQNLEGMVPLVLELARVDVNGQRIMIIDRQPFNALGFDSANRYFHMPITGAVLDAGLYEVHAETTQDKPLLFDMKIEFGISFRAKI